MKSTSFILIQIFGLLVCTVDAQVTGTFTDTRDGKTYKTITIGTQTWMLENLAYKTDAGCWAYDNDPKNVPVFGYLYTYSAARRACPDGWHIPTAEEWKTLITSQGDNRFAGDKLKTANWKKLESSPNNKSGFSAVAAGEYDADAASFSGKEELTSWWSSTVENKYMYTVFVLHYDASNVSVNTDFDTNGHSVRCVKD